MFLNEPHSVTRRYKALLARIGKDIYGRGHKLDPYYVSAFALYKLEYQFRNHKVDTTYKLARYHLLLAFRLLAADGDMPPFGSVKIEGYCKIIA